VALHVYTYSAATGVEKRGVLAASPDTVTVAVGISGEVVRRAELDVPTARYFTDPLVAIKAFIVKAETALADAARRKHHKDWQAALADAQKRLEGLSVTDKDKLWQERYAITSRSGKIWTRSEVVKRAIDKAHGLLSGSHTRGVIRTVIEPVIDDDAFMKPRTGMVPARVVEDAAFEALYKLSPTSVKP
jgi:hypothetical protein